MVTSVLKLGRSNTPLVTSPLSEDPPQITTTAPINRPTSALASLAKRSISASGLARKSSVPPGLHLEAERTRSHAPLERSQTAQPVITNSLPVATHATGPASKTLMSSLLGGHGRNPSPSPSLNAASGPPSPALNGTNVPSQVEASYISKVAAKLHEMVNKIFPAAGSVDAVGAIIYKGRCSARSDRAKDLGELIANEIQQAASNDPYLLRTLLRSAILRTLSVFLTRLEALISVTLSTSDSSAHPLWVPRSSANLLPPLDKRFEFDIVRTAYELKAALDKTCAVANMPQFVIDALSTWISNLEAIINKIINPITNEIRKEVALTIARAKSSFERVASGQNLNNTHTGSKALVEGPAYLNEVATQLDATKRFFSSLQVGADADRWIVSIATHLTWKGMLAFAARPCPADEERDKDRVLTSPIRPSAGRKPLLNKSGKRSPSPPSHSASHRKDAAQRLIDDITTFRNIIIQFTQKILPISIHPHSLAQIQAMAVASTVQELCDDFNLMPELEEEEEEGMPLTQEAMHEAMLALSSFELVVRALKWPEELKIAFLFDDEDSSSESSSDDEGDRRLTPSTVFNLVGPSSPASRVAAERISASKTSVQTRPATSRLVPIKPPCQTLDRALETLPPLISFHLLVSRLPSARNHTFRLPHEIWQLPGGWDDYTSQLTGFATGESFAEEVGWQMISELDRLQADRSLPEEGVWENLLRAAVFGEVGVENVPSSKIGLEPVSMGVSDLRLG